MAEHAAPADRAGSKNQSEGSSRSPFARLALLIGDKRSAVLILAATSVAGALCEAGILAIAAQAATALVDGRQHLAHTLGPLHLSVTIRELLWAAVGLAIVRLLLQSVISYYPGRISADVQSSMRRYILRSYASASWTIRSQDREGHFQELMTNQIGQASQGAIQATQLIVSLFTFLVLVVSAFALNFVAACAVFGAATILFAGLRPLNNLGGKYSRRSSAAQLEYAGSVGEANRVTRRPKSME